MKQGDIYCWLAPWGTASFTGNNRFLLFFVYTLGKQKEIKQRWIFSPLYQPDAHTLREKARAASLLSYSRLRTHFLFLFSHVSLPLFHPVHLSPLCLWVLRLHTLCLHLLLCITWQEHTEHLSLSSTQICPLCLTLLSWIQSPVQLCPWGHRQSYPPSRLKHTVSLAQVFLPVLHSLISAGSTKKMTSYICSVQLGCGDFFFFYFNTRTVILL